MCYSGKPQSIVPEGNAELAAVDASAETQKIMSQVQQVNADPTSITQFEHPIPEVQLAAITMNATLYWKLQNPCEAATIEYLCQRPFDILRFQGLDDEVKAKVITKSPKLIYDWVKHGHLTTPAEPEGFHDAVMREILTRIKSGSYSRTIMPTVTRMRRIGYDWPEFNAIERSYSVE